jgi:hypothetical protein
METLELERTGGIRGNTRGHLKHIGAMLLLAPSARSST